MRNDLFKVFKWRMRLGVFAAFFAILLLSVSAWGSELTAETGDYAPGQVIVTLRGPEGGLSARSLKSGEAADSIRGVAASLGAEPRTYTSLSLSSGNPIVHMVSETQSTEEMLAALGNDPRVLRAMPNYRVYASFVPNDKHYGDPYSTKSTITANWGYKAIGAEQAWDATMGIVGSSEPIYVAVLDSGINLSHPELVANIDKTLSKSFVGSDSGVHFGKDVKDTNGHGTHVSGTIAAVGNNKAGFLGLNWNTKIIALKVLGDDGTGYTTWTFHALDYLVWLQSEDGENPHKTYGLKPTSLPHNFRVHAANLSLGSIASQADKSTYEDAYKALDNMGKTVIVVAAGNYSLGVGQGSMVKLTNTKTGEVLVNWGDMPYPASINDNISIKNMIVVGAISRDVTGGYPAANFTNWSNTHVDLLAPGQLILSAGASSDDHHVWNDGTSMAAPHVTGAAAVLAALSPDLTASKIKEILLKTANGNINPITGPTYKQKYFSDGKPVSRHGLLDLASAVAEIKPKPDSITIYANGQPIESAFPPIILGSAAQLSANLEPSDNSWIIDWTSSKPAVATVQDGLVVPHAVGDTTITATVRGYKSISDSLEVNVERPRATSVTIDGPSTLTLWGPSGKIAEQPALRARALPVLADQDVTWGVYPYNGNLTIDTNGVLSGTMLENTRETFTVTATSNTSTSVSASITVVLSHDLRGEPEITIKGPGSLTLGGNATFSASFENVKPSAVEWSVDPSGVVDLKAGINWMATGPILIIDGSGGATWESDSRPIFTPVSGVSTVTLHTTGIPIKPVTLTARAVGHAGKVVSETHPLKIKLPDIPYKHVALTAMPPIWHRVGSADLTISANAQSAASIADTRTAKADVPQPRDIDIFNLTPGETLQLLALVEPANVDLSLIHWHSGNTDVATVDETGLVTAINEGETQVTASAPGDDETKVVYGTAVIRVSGDVVPPTGLTVTNADGDSIAVGTSKALTVTFTPQNATDKRLIWNSSNPEVARVGDMGNVFGVSSGDSTITAQSLNNPHINDSCTVKVTGNGPAIPVVNISVEPTQLDMKVGDIKTIEATPGLDDATNKTVTWSISDPNIATVDGGKVTAKEHGFTWLIARAKGSAGVRALIPVTVGVGAEALKEMNDALPGATVIDNGSGDGSGDGGGSDGTPTDNTIQVDANLVTSHAGNPVLVPNGGTYRGTFSLKDGYDMNSVYLFVEAGYASGNVTVTDLSQRLLEVVILPTLSKSARAAAAAEDEDVQFRIYARETASPRRTFKSQLLGFSYEAASPGTPTDPDDSGEPGEPGEPGENTSSSSSGGCNGSAIFAPLALLALLAAATRRRK